MAAVFTIEIQPIEDTFTPMLEWVEGRMVDIFPAYEALDAVFRKIEAKRFSDEGPGWEQLAESTVESRGSEHPILVQPSSQAEKRGRSGGQLRRSFTTKGAKGHVVEALPDGVFMGSNDFLAAIHDKGTDRAGRDHDVHIPARPLVDITEADAELFAEVLSEYFYGFALASSLGGADLFEADAMAGL